MAEMMAGAGMVGTMVGSVESAKGQIAAGNYAALAGQMQKTEDYSEAQQLDWNASSEQAAGQRRMFDTQLKTNMTQSTALARGAASGVDTAVGSPVDNAGNIAKRGSYQALMDMWNGENAATGLRNKAGGLRYSGDVAELGGEVQKKASRTAAIGTLASGFGSAMSMGGKVMFPTARGSAGVSS